MAKSETVYDAPPPLHSKRPKAKPPKWFQEHACLNEKQWSVLTEWCAKHFKTIDALPVFQTVNIALCGLPKRNAQGGIRAAVEYEVPPAEVPRSKIDSNSITEALTAARFQVKRKGKQNRSRG